MRSTRTYIRSRAIMFTAVLAGTIIWGAAAAMAADVPAPLQGRVETTEAEQLLADLGYWITKVDGIRDDSTRQAIIAFQKVEGLKRTGVLTRSLLEAMRTATRPTARFTGAAHVEIDLERQVLFLVDDAGQVTRTLAISSGSGKKYFDQGKWQTAFTPKGEFKITRQIKGVRKASLGSLYYPSYFYEGWAIHGANSVPAYPASHGCARVPRFADKQLANMLSVGMPVYVY